MDMKRALVLLLIVVFLTGICLTGCASEEEIIEQANAKRDEWIQATSALRVPEMDGVEAINITSYNDKCAVWAAYPTVDGKGSISSEIESFINATINDFISASSLKAEEENGYQGNMVITYEPFKYEDKVFSVKFDVKKDDVSTVKTFAYTLEDEQKMPLSSLFAEDSDYLTVLSQDVKPGLSNNTFVKANYDEAKFNEGTAPSEGNFSDFTVDDEKLVLYFPVGRLCNTEEEGYVQEQVKIEDIEDLLASAQVSPISDLIAEDSETRKMLAYGEGDMAPASLDGIDPFNDKVVAFTFDDGPSPKTTPQLLDFLEENGLVATFFVCGENGTSLGAKFNPDVIKRMREIGCEIGDHSYDHEKYYEQVGYDEMMEEINSCRDLIKEITGERPILGRAPGGNITEELAEQSGRASFLWSVDTLDWKNRDKDKNYRNLMDGVTDGSVVLMHDIYQPTVDAAIKGMAELKDQGYKFVTASQMLQIADIRGADPVYKFYNAPKAEEAQGNTEEE